MLQVAFKHNVDVFKLSVRAQYRLAPATGDSVIEFDKCAALSDMVLAEMNSVEGATELFADNRIQRILTPNRCVRSLFFVRVQQMNKGLYPIRLSQNIPNNWITILFLSY